MRWLRFVPAILLGGCLLSGCTIVLKDKGGVSVEFTQGFKVSHETSNTDATAEARTEVPALVSWLFPDDDQEPADETD